MESDNKNNHRDLTARQFLALKYWREDKFRNKARALRKAGYSEAIARQPHKFFNSPTIKDELYFLGLGDRVSRYQREQKVSFKDWKREQEKQESEKKKADDVIRNMPLEQILKLKEMLKEEGYAPYPVKQETQSSNYYPDIDNQSFDGVFGIGSNTDRAADNHSFSSM